ncbi:MAG: Lytic transglycosylase catalytic [Candidatus Saganbacteria bacterium]|uniref:Lytic transglycosylase catalytic n=1 Tax=Candidatus Saganbacteria bacterium TaxID=2575572 RepID=A0A833NSC1_UNCSA|nr:MAG: Lytic transglycosylase catalytic [Candidatus Saganbacteria bacterium]
MDGSAATVVILIFVFSIVASVTNKTPKTTSAFKEPKQETFDNYSQFDTSQTYTQTDIKIIPEPVFPLENTEGIVQNIKSFILKYAKKVEEWEAQSIADSILKYGQIYNVNPKLACALIARESRFNRFAVSPSGAQGLGQLLPSTAVGLGVYDPFDIDQNVKGTVRYLKSLLDRFENPDKVTFSLAGYLEGPNNVKKRGGFKGSSKKYIEDIYNIYQKI